MALSDHWKPPRLISVVVDNDSWILPWAKRLVEACRAEFGDDSVLCRSYEEVQCGTAAFFLGCTSLAPDEILERNAYTLVVHASAVPEGRGFAPLTWQILEGRNRIPVTLLAASSEPDAGAVYSQRTLDFEGHELNDELRAALGACVVDLCIEFLGRPAPPEGTPQRGNGSWYRRRWPADSEIDPEATIASQFDMLRVVDNERYPAYFDYRGHRYRLRIDKVGRTHGSETGASTARLVIDGRTIAADEPPYVIAEVSANHNGSLARAKEIIAMAHECGADAVKIQTYSPDSLTIDCDRDEFLIKDGLWRGRTLYSLYEAAQTPFEWQAELFVYARSLGITIFSTPFDEAAVNLLEHLDAPAYKVASFEAVDLPLLARIARTGRPLIISTGMADLGEIAEAVECARGNGCRDIALLHCVSAYPAPVEQANLRTIPDLADRFGLTVGLSDHTPGTAAAVAGVALGARIIEKHVTLSRADGGPDAPFSLEPSEVRRLVEDARAAWSALGSATYERAPAERSNEVFRRSIFVVKDLEAGEAFTRDNIRVIRPGYGLAPKHYANVLGRHAVRSMQRGQPLTADDVDSIEDLG